MGFHTCMAVALFLALTTYSQAAPQSHRLHPTLRPISWAEKLAELIRRQRLSSSDPHTPTPIPTQSAFETHAPIDGLGDHQHEFSSVVPVGNFATDARGYPVQLTEEPTGYPSVISTVASPANEGNGFYDDYAGKVVQSINHFALSLYGEIKQQKNFVFSPWSLSSALSLLYLGSNGTSAKQLEHVLGFSEVGISKEQVHLGFKQENDLLSIDTLGYDVEAVNTILVQQHYGVLDSFKEAANTYYGAYVQQVDFTRRADDIPAIVNAWATWKTRNGIRELMKFPPDKMTRLILLNAVHFRGLWEEKFNYTNDGEFWNDGVTAVETPILRLTSNFSYWYDNEEKLQALQLPYKDNRFAFLLVMPQKVDGLPELEKKISQKFVEKIVSKLTWKQLQVSLPKFELNSEYDLNAALSNMGVPSVFDLGQADLSNIDGSRDLYVSSVLHRCKMEVTEEGSTAAGGTVVSIAGRFRSQILDVNRPFFFLIRHVETGAVVFAGRVTEL